MRKLFLFPAVLLGISVAFQSCSKESTNQSVAPMSTNIVNATVGLNASYQLPIENSGNVSISKQASHFRLSQTELDNKSGLMVYKYVPAADYRGTDEVVLSTTKISLATEGSGCSGSRSNTVATSSTSYTTIKINITD